ncbi:EamA family transporter [Pseudanabaena mucicola]|uniref:EamA family transporter n=1 Tax=Pseudanabaena mucicola FACHB-723 TaxID=2692860 RepID=A0ABR7ZXJ6_9CYAN|nr:EamA family transporter [Pseudanabaena mucicola]MBD2188688.1 EamA family transporter [Pseudanabaena mucicola FACHB-723]
MESNNIRSSAYEQTLAGVTKDLSDLRANILGKLSREILILQAQKNALNDDIQRLQSQRKELEVLTVAQQGMSQQEIQRQQWIEQLAQAITYHLKNDVIAADSRVLSDHSENFEQLMLNLDNAIRATFQVLQRDVDTYQRDLDDQMQRMFTQRQQGELMLSALVERIDEYLRRSAGERYSLNPPISPSISPSPNDFTGAIATSGNPTVPNSNGSFSQIQVPNFSNNPPRSYDQNVTRPYADLTEPLELVEPMQGKPHHQQNDWWTGFTLVVIASVVLSLQHILVRLVFVNSTIFGAFKFGGLLEANISNSLFLLLLRMLFATPIMWLLARFLFRVDVTRDFQQLLAPSRRLLFWRVGFSAFLQMISFVLLYVSLGLVSSGLAVTLSFIFPTITVLIAWFFFGERPSSERWVVIGGVYLGIALACNIFGVPKPDTWGITAAILSGIAFAGYIITSQVCFKQLNPASFVSINFVIIFLICLGALPFTLATVSWSGSLVWIGFLIALTTLVGYLLTSFGTKLMGAAQASIVSASAPLFTTILASVILSDNLGFGQLFGVFLVTVGVALIHLQTMHKKPNRP